MPVTAYWLDQTKKDIVWYGFDGEWTWDDFYPVYEEVLRMVKAQTHRVDLIMDLRDNLSLPPNALTHIKGITDRQPENVGLAVLITNTRFISVMFNAAAKFYPKTREYYVVVPTLEDAHARIIEDREKRSAHS